MFFDPEILSWFVPLAALEVAYVIEHGRGLYL